MATVCGLTRSPASVMMASWGGPHHGGLAGVIVERR